MLGCMLLPVIQAEVTVLVQRMSSWFPFVDSSLALVLLYLQSLLLVVSYFAF